MKQEEARSLGDLRDITDEPNDEVQNSKHEGLGMSTVEDLEAARRDLADWLERFDNYSGNNPDKYQSHIKAARRRVRQLEDDLKASGDLPLSPQEELAAKLDRAFPSAKSKEIVEYEGRKFQRRFWPLERSNSGKSVTEWGKGWEEIK